MEYKEFKEELLKNAKAAGACSDEYKRALKAETIEELIVVIKDNLNFTVTNQLVTHAMSESYEKSELFNCGDGNVGLFNSGNFNSGNFNSGNFNSGDQNSGYRNSGDQNSGYQNSGYRNSGDLNSGDRNSGDRNSGDLNSGYRNSGDLNSGDLNSGDLNSGYRNSGYRNSGDLNSGDLNSGDLNSGDLNSGYRNSGVFCTRKREDTVPFFNKESEMTWDEWYCHKAYDLVHALNITTWVSWSNMTEEEKKEKPKAYVCEGYLKTFTYKEAWLNLWNKLSEEERNVFKTLPNFDSAIFEEITGIKF